MMDIDNLCLKCFSELTEGAVCAECGFDNDVPNDTMYLAQKTVLAEKYIVGAVIGKESDAVTYAGYDIQLDKKITIREFFPTGIANRLEGATDVRFRQKYLDIAPRYKSSFYRLWTSLEKMHSLSAVVPVYDVFEDNNTVYAIIEHMECIPLREYLLRNENGYILWDSARLMFMPVLTTLEAMHSNGIIHGSISPDNLVLCRDGKVRLSPFCIQECADISSPLEFTGQDGYAALEQYDNNHKMGPATDIYAFSACIYRALVGTNPPSAQARETNDKIMIPNSIAETIPMHVIKAIGGGMQVYPEKRIKSISDFRERLDAAPSVQAQAAVSTNYTIHQEYEEQQNKKSRIIIIVLVVLIVAAIAAGIYVVEFTDLVKQPETTTVAQEVKQYEVPNFVGTGYTKSDIENNGAWNQQFTITFEADYSTDVEEGIIFKQSVAAGETVDAGSEIILTVSKGIQTVQVPDLGGKTLEDATKELEGLGLKVSSVEVYNDGGHTPNTVKSAYGTAPSTGESVAVGAEVIIQVYGEVQTTTQPSTEATTKSTTANADED
ncbi:MAG: PASTA domain-containing protein [Eubacterium sp.]|nr:PASTA domain-containing protein [Eubacterium sp.]